MPSATGHINLILAHILIFSGTYEGLVAFGEHLMKNPLIIGFFLLIIKVFWTFREKVPEVNGEFIVFQLSNFQPS